MQNNLGNQPKFFVDAMLGNIAKKLRLLGYDTKYSSDIDDQQLCKISKEDNRILISKDMELVNRAIKEKISSLLIENYSETEQFLEIFKNLKINNLRISGDKARCPRCNSLTNLIDKENIDNVIPDRILEYHKKFWQCKSCNQIYWEGTHIKKLKKFVDDLNERL